MSDEDVKPSYFANGDFEKTVADIIASPRRAKYTADPQESLFVITEKQKEYYTKCFKHLLKTTQGTVTDFTNGALNGADSQVVEFFKRSGLETSDLSRIWALSDVNEDGWLNLSEFSLAMHLIVLRVKGEVPIPSTLPPHIRPPHTPLRSNVNSQVSPGMLPVAGKPPPPSIPSTLPVSMSSRVNPSWDQFAVPYPPTSAISTINGKEEISLAQFSDVPPLLVDSRPTAVKAAPVPLMLSLKSPSGPPPQPPPRPAHKGHARSVSLDLKTFNQQSLSNNLAPDRRDSDSTAMTSSLQSVPPTTTAVKPSTSGPMPIVPPPVPSRISPPGNRPTNSAKSVETQTDIDPRVHEEAVEKFIQSLRGKIENLLGDEVSASEGKGVDRWEHRCKALRQQNLELELERARLAQVRIQLELRLQEVEEQQRMSSVTTKPTDL